MYVKSNAIFPTSAILFPFWLDIKMKSLKRYFKDKDFYNSFSDCETLVDAVIKVSSFSDLMAYNEEYPTVREYMEKYRVIHQRHPDKEAKNIVEISGEPDIPQVLSLHKEFMKDRDAFLNFISEASQKYGGITIHYFDVWYKHLYCVWPNYGVPYDGGMPKNC